MKCSFLSINARLHFLEGPSDLEYEERGGFDQPTRRTSFRILLFSFLTSFEHNNGPFCDIIMNRK